MGGGGKGEGERKRERGGERTSLKSAMYIHTFNHYSAKARVISLNS